MNQTNHFTPGVRVANFSDIDLPVEHLLDFDSEDIALNVKKIRRYADLPYVFVVAKKQAKSIVDVLSALKAIRSPCYAYALFSVSEMELNIDNAALDIVQIGSGDADTIQNRIDEYTASRLHFNDGKLRVGSTGSPPATVDVVIVGGGITGLYAANRLKQRGISFCIVEKAEKIGGIWSTYANATSRVNSSECAYRRIENKTRSNRDHSSTREILDDLARLATHVSDHLYLKTKVERAGKSRDRYQIRTIRDGEAFDVESKGIILAINDRVGAPERLNGTIRRCLRGTSSPVYPIRPMGWIGVTETLSSWGWAPSPSKMPEPPLKPVHAM